VTNTKETPRELLERKRAEKAARDQAAQTADTASAPVVQVGDVIHATATGMHLPRTTSLWGGPPALQITRGDRIVVTEELIEASRDRNGNLTWPAMVHDEAAQLRRWGKIHLAPGEPPADMQPWIYGDASWSEAREVSRRAAWAETDPQRRAAALQKVTEVFGAPPTTSTVTATYKGDADADAQQQRIAAGAATGAPNLGGAR
jgi:hypothetical protein